MPSMALKPKIGFSKQIILKANSFSVPQEESAKVCHKVSLPQAMQAEAQRVKGD